MGRMDQAIGDGLAQRRRNPGQNAVKRDIVESAEIAGPSMREFGEVGLDEPDVGEAGGGRELPRVGDMVRLEVDPDELGCRIGSSEQTEAEALPATKLEVAGRAASPRDLEARGLHAQVEPQRRQFAVEAVGVADRRIVAVGAIVAHDQAMTPSRRQSGTVFSTMSLLLLEAPRWRYRVRASTSVVRGHRQDRSPMRCRPNRARHRAAAFPFAWPELLSRDAPLQDDRMARRRTRHER